MDLNNYKNLLDPSYLTVIWRTVWVSFFATALCLLVATPTAYYMSRLSPKWRQTMMFLIIVPFWTNFLVRIFAWKLFLNPEGIFQHILIKMGLASVNTMLLYNTGTVILVMIYTYIPFAILPIYAAAEKFDFNLIEAAHDLGAGRFRAFCKIFLPGISKGLKTAAFMVLIPCLGSYVIPDIVGGTGSDMIGNIIASRVFVARNIPMSATWSSLLILIVMLPLGMLLTVRILRQRKQLK